VKLWLLRHAPVEAAAGLCYGASDLGCAAGATHAVAAAISPLLPAGMALCSSPLQRCETLARAIAVRRPDLGRVEIDARLAEMDFGAWEGRPWESIARSEFDGWMADFADAPAGVHGESTRLFMARVGAAWDTWRASRRDALWVTHAGVMRAAFLLQQGVRCPEDAGAWPRHPIAFGEWVTLEA
jgi:alpha-ribazole phosphatase